MRKISISGKLNQYFFLILFFLGFNFQTVYSQCQWDVYNTTNSGLPDYYINDMFVDQYDNVWFTTYMGLAKFDGNSGWTLFNSNTTGGGLPNDYLNLVKEDYSGNIWVSHSEGISRFDGTDWLTYNSLNSPLTGNNIISVAPDNYGNVWFSSMGTKDGGVCFFNNVSTWHSFDTASTPGLVSDQISYISIDNLDNVWFASGSFSESGITRFSGPNWTLIPSADTIMLNNLKSIYPDSKGNIWVLSNEWQGVLKFDGVDWQYFNSQNSGLTYDYINCVAEDIYQNMWFGTNSGAFRLDENNNWTVYTTNQGLPDNMIRGIAADSRGYIYFNTYSGVGRMKTLANLNAYILYDGTMINSPYVKLELYNSELPSVFGGDSLFYKLDTTLQYFFAFENILPGNYYLKAVKKNNNVLTDALNSYYAFYDTTYLWTEATLINITECSSNYVNLNMFTIDTNIVTGNGIFSGNISYNNQGAKSNGEPVPGAEVYIEQEPNDLPYFSTQTDSSGNFIIDNLPDGTGYVLVIDIPGFPQIETYDSLEISSINFMHENLNFVVDTDGIYIEHSSGIEQQNGTASLNVFPNPFVDEFYIELNIDSEKITGIELFNNSGVVTAGYSAINSGEGKTGIRFRLSQEIIPGIYILKVQTNENCYIRKIICSK